MNRHSSVRRTHMRMTCAARATPYSKVANKTSGHKRSMRGRKQTLRKLTEWSAVTKEAQTLASLLSTT